MDVLEKFVGLDLKSSDGAPYVTKTQDLLEFEVLSDLFLFLKNSKLIVKLMSNVLFYSSIIKFAFHSVIHPLDDDF